jgi:DNA methylase
MELSASHPRRLYGTDAGIDEDVRWLVRQGDTERLGYPTQKPLGLLERVIRSSTDEGDLVLDPFCGCGTTVTAAQTLKRRWVGIDITYLHRPDQEPPVVSPRRELLGERRANDGGGRGTARSG